MDVVALRRQGFTITDIAAEVGRHPETVSKWLRQGGPPARRQVAATVIDRCWVARIDRLLERNPNLLATSVARILAAEGFAGSYPTVVRHLRAKRGIRRGRTTSATMPIETAPGEEAQVDWSDCTEWGRALGLGRCTASARSCVGAGIAYGGLPPAWTGPTRWRGWCGSSRTPAASPAWCAWTTWGRWWPAPTPGWCCTPRRGSSPPLMGSRSRAAGRGCGQKGQGRAAVPGAGGGAVPRACAGAAAEFHR
jgi:Homeodomain-like domain